MNLSEYNSSEYIKHTRDSINKILDQIGNEVYVFDFGHYILKDSVKQSYYFKSVIFGSESYKNQLFPNDKIKTDIYNYTHFESNIKQIKNIPPSSNLNKGGEQNANIELKLPREIIVANMKFETNNWINDLEKIGINGCLFVYAKTVGNYQSGVWLVLKNRIDLFYDELLCFGFKNECTNCPEQNESRKCLFHNEKNYFQDKLDLKLMIDEVFLQLDNLLINELVFNAEEYARQIEVERLAFKKFQEEIIEVHAHTIKNCFPDIRSMKNNIESLIPHEEFLKIKDIIEEVNIGNDELVHIITRVTKSNYDKSYNVIEILDYLKKLTKPSETDFVPSVFQGESELIDYFRLTKEQEDNAFTLFWNLWKNCKTASNDFKIPFQVSLKNNYNNELEITFISEIPNYDQIQNVLNIINSKDLPKKEPKGLNIVRHKTFALGWDIIAINFGNQLKIKITTKNDKYENINS